MLAWTLDENYLLRSDVNEKKMFRLLKYRKNFVG